MQLLRAAVPVIAAGPGIAWLHPWARHLRRPDGLLGGSTLALMGTGCAAIGYRRRLREIGSDVPSAVGTTAWLSGGSGVVLAGGRSGRCTSSADSGRVLTTTGQIAQERPALDQSATAR